MTAPLVESMLNGDIRALSRILSVVEDRRDGYMDILKDLYRNAGRARIIGITGPPGAGKSTLVNGLIARFRKKDSRVAVVAVDPSSAFSGGALLGDRIRMSDAALDDGVFIRSMATRGHMGGLATATDDVVTVLDSAGYDVVLVETVGVGQDEVDIVREADTVLVTLVPGLGDDIQAIKAGIMEIADVFVVNKADRDGVGQLEKEIRAMMELATEKLEWEPPIVKTIAARGEGLEDLIAAMDSHMAYMKEHRLLAARRKLKYRDKFWSLLAEGFLADLRKRSLSPEEEEALLAKFLSRETDPYSATETILGRIRWEGGNP
ncbi:MAG: methylmalonyl Co-A mutase-associated GTPase MeaB [Acidobacteriota bacterium]